MKFTQLRKPFLPILCAIAALTLSISGVVNAQEKNTGNKAALAHKKPTRPTCVPNVVWSQSLPSLLTPTAKFPVRAPANDCEFHQWSWETFLWATSIDPTLNVPRFMTLPTPSDLFNPDFKLTQARSTPPTLSLGLRAHNNPKGVNHENAGAIVEADGNLLVSQDGYPVYASVHMNAAYFTTAQNNLIYNGNYLQNQAGAKDGFPVGAVVFKATWRRYDGAAPANTYTTKALVPELALSNGSVAPAVDANGNVKTVLANVALVGLHVVGRTHEHGEFLWGTFEQKNNAPMVPNGEFNTSCTSGQANCVDVSPNSYTFYQANTPFAQANIATQPASPSATPLVYFDSKTQKFSPVTQVVQANSTGGESAAGTANINALNTAGQSFAASISGTQAVFQNYNLIGTVWLAANSYSRNTPNWWNLGLTNPIGSVNLANSTAETFQQVVPGGNPQGTNCFLCHNPTSFGGTQGTVASGGTVNPVGSPTAGKSGLPARLVGLSHVIAAQSNYAVANTIQAGICTDVNAGPIMDNTQAQTVCPSTCAATSPASKWNGQWTTTQPGVQSVCGCCQN